MPKTFLAGAAITVLSIFSTSAQDQTALKMRTPQQVVEHHWAAFSDRDIDAVLSDYANDAVFIAPKQTVQGKEALRKMFETFFVGSPAANSKLPAPTYQVKVTADGDVAYEHWVSNPGEPGSMEGTDAFVVRQGKILFHTVVAVHAAGAQR
jgi:uncharacterized protein (TIGR02246 family)